MRPDLHRVKHVTGAYARVLSVPGREYAIEWLHPESGAVDRFEGFRHAGGGKALRSPDFDSGLALRLTGAR